MSYRDMPCRGLTTSSREEVLRRRFACGEIDDEEYERSLEVLREDRNATREGV